MYFWEGKRGSEWWRLALDAIPIVLLAPLVLNFVGNLLNDVPLALAFLIPPAALLIGAVLWLRHIEPEPTDARVFSFCWGSIVAVGVGALGNEIVTYNYGLFAGLVISAPVLEELLKGLVLLSLARHRLINSPLDGAIYAFWSAAGFALVEDLIYFADAFELEGLAGLLTVGVARGLITPFAHPLFSIWMGLAVGYALNGTDRRAKPPRSAGLVVVGGTAMAIGLHMIWNGAFYFGEAEPTAIIIVIPAFMALFAATCVLMVRMRQHETRAFASNAWWLTTRFGLSPEEYQVFADTSLYLRVRKGMDWESKRHLISMRRSMHRVLQIHQRQQLEPGWRHDELLLMERQVRGSRKALLELGSQSRRQR